MREGGSMRPLCSGGYPVATGESIAGVLVRYPRFREMHEIAGGAKPAGFFSCLPKEGIFAPELCVLEGWLAMEVSGSWGCCCYTGKSKSVCVCQQLCGVKWGW